MYISRMSVKYLIIVSIVLVIKALRQISVVDGYSAAYSRADFPDDFIFGAGSSAYQVEGAVFEDGRTASMLDTFNSLGNTSGHLKSCDQYHKYKEDVKLMADAGLDAYKFTISWSRLIPNGRGPVNPKAVEYYNNLINELINHGIQPHVLLVHMDHPQALEDEYGGWISRQIIKDFTAYADVCFREFGDRVLFWTTINEPNIEIGPGYDAGTFAPGRCSAPFGSCAKGNSTTEPYIAGHNTLLAHASAVRLYKRKYQANQGGYIGLNLFAGWFRPKTNTEEDLVATQRAASFIIGWFLDPLMYGDYPKIMKKNAGSRLPSFTDNESKLVKSSFDFIGINCYTSLIVQSNLDSLKTEVRDMNADAAVAVQLVQGNGSVIRHVLEYFKEAYGNPPIYIHESGYPMSSNASLDDTPRISYLKDTIGSVLDAQRDGANVKGYFVWSLLDMKELQSDFYSFGLYYVDFNDPDVKRYPKQSAHWYSAFLKGASDAKSIQTLSTSTMVYLT